MGSDPKEGLNGRSGSPSRSKRGGNKPRTPIISFNPSKEEKLEAKARVGQGTLVMDRLALLVARNVKITVGYDGSRESYFVIAREETEDWTTAQALSAWHKDLGVCLAALTVAVDGPFEGFPDVSNPGSYSDTDW